MSATLFFVPKDIIRLSQISQLLFLNSQWNATHLLNYSWKEFHYLIIQTFASLRIRDNMNFLFSYMKSMIIHSHCILQMTFQYGNFQLKICHLFMCSLVGSTDLSQRISSQVSKCIAVVGGPYTVCHVDQHLRVQLPSTCQIGLTRCFGGPLVPLRSFSVATVLVGMATRKRSSSG